MKVLYITQFYSPEPIAAAFRATENSKIWSKNGNEIKILTSNPNFPKGRIFDNYTNNFLSITEENNSKIYRVKTIPAINKNIFYRIYSASAFVLYGCLNLLFNYRKFKGYDVILATSGTIFAPIVGLFAQILSKKPLVIEFRDITHIQYLASMSDGKRDIKYKVIKWLELFFAKKANKVVVVTNGFKEYLSQYIPENKITVIPNGVIIVNEKNNLEKRFEKNRGELVFGYFGTLGISQDIEKIIQFFREIEIENKRLYIIGEGARKETIREMTNNDCNIVVLDGMKEDELENYYGMVDFTFVTLKNHFGFKDTIPSKIFQSLGRGIPVIFFGPKGEAAEILKQGGYNFIVTKNEIGDSVQRFNKFLENYDFYKAYLFSQKFISDNFDREKLAEEYEALLYKLIEED